MDSPRPDRPTNGTAFSGSSNPDLSVGKVLGPLPYTVKARFGHGSIAHTGYMLVALGRAGNGQFVQSSLMTDKPPGLQATVSLPRRFWIMKSAVRRAPNLPSRDGKGSAETFEDLDGTGRKMSAWVSGWRSAVQLIGHSANIGFMGKMMIIKPRSGGSATMAPGSRPVRRP